MAEYKNGFDFRGGKPVSSKDVNHDVQTGRAIHYDSALAADDTYNAKVRQCEKEGYHIAETQLK